MDPEPASVCCIRTTLHFFSATPGHICVFSSLLASNDVELCGFTFAHGLFDHVWVVPGDCCLVDKNVLADVVANDEAVPIPKVKPFNSSEHLSRSVSAQVAKAVLNLLEMFSGVPVLSEVQ